MDIAHEVAAHRLESHVQYISEENLEAQRLGGHACLYVDLVDCSELEHWSLQTIFVGAFEVAVVNDVEREGVCLELGRGVEAQPGLLCDAAAVEHGPRGKGKVKVVDEIEEVASVELEGAGHPVIVEFGIEPAVGLHVVDHSLINAVGLEILRVAVNPTWGESYAKSLGLRVTVVLHSGSVQFSILVTKTTLYPISVLRSRPYNYLNMFIFISLCELL